MAQRSLHETGSLSRRPKWRRLRLQNWQQRESCYPTVDKAEWPAEPPLEQPGRRDRHTSIPGAIEWAGHEASVAHEVSSDSADHHANYNRWKYTPA